MSKPAEKLDWHRPGTVEAGSNFLRVVRKDDKLGLVPVAPPDPPGPSDRTYMGNTMAMTPWPNVGFDGSKFQRGISSTGYSPTLYTGSIRQNCRNIYHDSTVAHALVNRTADVVIDTGLICQPNPIAAMLGISQEQATAWAADVGPRFHSWCMDKKASRDETQNWYQMQRTMEIGCGRDGEAFIRFYYSARRDLQNPLQLQLLDPNQIRGQGVISTAGLGASSYDGIVRDGAGRAVAFKIWVWLQEKKQYVERTVPAWGPKSKLQMMTHVFQSVYPGQGRGISRLAPVVQDCEALQSFTLSQIYKAINQSTIALYNKPSKDNPASDPTAAFQVRYGAGPDDDVVGAEAEGVTPESVLPLDQYVKYIELPEATFRQPGAVGVFNLQEGEELKPFENTSPAQAYDTFVDSFTSYISAASSMPLEALLQKFNSNYSASRAALVMLWRVAEILRHEKETDALNPVYRAWLSGEIAAGRVRAPGWSDPRLQAAWLNATYMGAPIPNIDPLKQAKAAKENMALGITTGRKESKDYDRSDVMANHQQLDREYETLPIPYWEQK
jgi:capsid protein